MNKVNRRTFMVTASGLAVMAVMPPAFAQSAKAQPVRGGVLRVSVNQAASVIHPLRTRVQPEHLVAELCYSNLTKLTPEMTAEPDLAESWSSNDDLTEWTFKLRAGVKFHDGSPFTASDVVATYAAIKKPETGSPARAIISIIDSVMAIDDATVVMKLSSPFADLPTTVAFTSTRIIPAAIAEGDIERLSREAVGTGPFKLVSFEPDRQIIVERNDDYFIEGQPYLDRIEVRVYPDAASETSAMLSGDNDLQVIVSESEFERVNSAGSVDAMQVTSGQFLNVNMRCDEPPFNDLRVRKALSLTVDRDALVGFIALGAGSRGEDVPVNSAYRFFKKQEPKPLAIEEAKRLLAEAGYPDGIDLNLVASDTPGTRTQLAIALREMAAPAGFRINVQTMPHATYLDQVWKKGNFYVGFYNTQATIDGVFTLLYTSDAAWNETKWNNAEFDELVKKARETTDEATRSELYGKAQDVMYKGVPSITPLFFNLLAAKQKYVQGYTLHPRGQVFRFERVWLAEGAPERR
ncbi:peptide/nickel transport system substrate-binding protein [Rhizobium leguminosarum]|uniref:ABC transporter substrate-binding protein n=1 Tax=Rhizobium TaxID=379 RepID=UPI00183C99B0|nr:MULTISPECIES: ABC transporter substrate-binding protein [Rhizobium]MBB4299421.1 peptide/nickel transport system substrate-binding protein [Rhizobium leguminosarum]MBB4436428.1 peptide/nickel transport system substrate-binding protein [Rhizobium esperanzae]MBB5683742.1 peptide/nickel transport system substrate-binding protein [Rhizobium leguminosarum]MBB6267706.1 peptide/nickel transport system substrate-binding protein [Rhizobium leguminosarum]